MADTVDRDQRLASTGRVTVVASRWRTLPVLGICVAFVAVGLLLLRGGTGGGRDVVLALSTGFFALGIPVLGWRVLRPVSFDVRRAGIRYRGIDIAWDDVVAVDEWKVASNRMIVLLLTDAAAARLASSSTRRALMRADARVVGHANIAIPGPFADFPGLVTWLEDVRVAQSSPTAGPLGE